MSHSPRPEGTEGCSRGSRGLHAGRHRLAWLAGVIFLALAHALPARAVVRQLTPDSDMASLVRLSDAGHAVWQTHPDAVLRDREIRLWNGVAAQTLPHTIIDDAQPQINNAGHVVWQGHDGSDWEIYLWNGLTILPLTDNQTADTDPQISDSGQVVWAGSEGTDSEIYLWNGSTVQRLTDNTRNDTAPRINRAGQVVWVGGEGAGREIYLWDGSAVRQLTDNALEDRNLRINIAGQVVWQGFDGSDWEIYLWDGTTVRQLTRNNLTDTEPRISDSGPIVWQHHDGEDGEIHRWDGTAVRPLTENRINELAPEINAAGAVVWMSDSAGATGVYLWDGSSVQRISPSADAGSAPQINRLGEVVWSVTTSDRRIIYLFSPPGLHWLTLEPPAALGGSITAGRITRREAAPAGGITLGLTSANPALAMVPATVFLRAGATTATFPIRTAPVTAPRYAAITAAAGEVIRSAALAVAPVVLTEFTLDPPGVTGGSPVTAKVRLSGPAPSGGVTIALSSIRPDLARIPDRVVIPAGAQEATVTVTTVPVPHGMSVTLTAIYGNRRELHLSIQPARLASLTLDPISVTGGNPVTGRATLDGPAPAGGRRIPLASANGAAAIVPESVTVPAGERTAIFSIRTAPVVASLYVEVTASSGEDRMTVPLLVLSPDVTVGGGAVQVIPLVTNDLVYSAITHRIYASVPGSVPMLGNSLTAIDPITGRVGPAVLVGSEPSLLALTAAGQWVYVSLDGESAIRRFDVATGMAGLQFSLGSHSTYGPYRALDLATLPGEPEAVAVLRDSPVPYSGSPSIAIYDRGVPRPAIVQDGARIDKIEPSATASRLYGLAPELYRGEIYRLQVDGSGVSVIDRAEGLLAGSRDIDIRYEDGLLYTTGGRVIDPEARQLVGVLSGIHAPALVAPDARRGRIYFLSGEGPTRRLLAFDSRTLVLAGVQDITGIAGTPGSLIRWGGDGLAFRTSEGQVFLIRSSLVPQAALSVAFSPASVVGGAAATGTVQLPVPAPEGGVELRLESSHPAVSVPAQVTVPAGATTATFTAGTTPVAEGVSALITAAAEGATGSARLQVQAPVLEAVTLDPPRVAVGGVVRVTLTLNGPAPAGGAVVSLSSGSFQQGALPDQVTVPAGATSATFSFTAASRFADRRASVRATYGVTREVTLEILPDVVSVTFNPATVPGGRPSVGTVQLRWLAPPGGLVVQLASGDPSIATVPAQVTVPAGTLTAHFPVTTSRPPASRAVLIRATVGGVTRSGRLEVWIAALDSLALEPNPATGGREVTGRVVLSGPAPAGGLEVRLTSAKPALARVPAAVTVPEGARSVPFSITTAVVPTNASVDLSAASGSLVRGATLMLLSAEPMVGADSVFKMPLATHDLASDPVRRRLYASIPARAVTRGNTITAIDPFRGLIGASIPTAGEPGRLALSDDARYLYVALDDGTKVQRIDLQTGVAEPPFVLGADPARGPYRVEDMAVLAGAPEALAISRGVAAEPGAHASVAIYDNGIPRPMVAERPGGRILIAAGDSPARLYGYHTGTGMPAYLRLAVNANGVSVAGVAPGPQGAGGLLADLDFAGGLLYTNLGNLISPEALQPVGRFDGIYYPRFGGQPLPTNPPLVEPDAASRRVFFLTGDGAVRPLQVFDTERYNFPRVGVIGIPGVFGTASSLVRWGQERVPPGGRVDDAGDGLAFRTDAGQLFLIRTSLAEPVRPEPEFSVTVEPAAVLGGTELTGTISLRLAAPRQGTRVTLASDNSAVAVPDEVIIPPGRHTAIFRIRTRPVAAPATARISAATDGVTRADTLQVLPAGVVSVVLSPNPVVRGRAVTGTVTLSGPAPEGGAVVMLTSDNPAVARPPAGVTVRAGETRVSFPVPVFRVRTPTVVRIGATAGGETKAATLTVLPAGIATLTIRPERVVGGTTAQGTVTLRDPAPEGGARVALSSNRPEVASPPLSVTIPAGARSVTFPVVTQSTSASTRVTITASFGGVAATAGLSVLRR